MFKEDAIWSIVLPNWIVLHISGATYSDAKRCHSVERAKTARADVKSRGETKKSLILL